MTHSAHARPAPLSGPCQAAMFQLQQAGPVSLNREGGDEYAV
jgi:hypothetical protein